MKISDKFNLFTILKKKKLNEIMLPHSAVSVEFRRLNCH